MLEILKLILSDISKNIYVENYMWGNKKPRTQVHMPKSKCCVQEVQSLLA